MPFTRRHFLQTSAAVAALPFPQVGFGQANRTIQLSALEQTSHWFENAPAPLTHWGYDQAVLHLEQAQPVSINFNNLLAEPTTVHWHGIKVSNDMDGVSGLTQAPVAPGKNFNYQFTPRDAGTFWAHSHHQSYQQLAMGLYLPIIVSEANGYSVDQDLLFVADDWRISQDWQIDQSSFKNMHDWSHNGRLGNFLTINRKEAPDFTVAAGERIRLRLINTANSRILNFKFTGLAPVILAKDGQPLQEPVPAPSILTIGPAERYDLLIDFPEDWQGSYPIHEMTGREPYIAASWQVDNRPVENNRTRPITPLPANPVPPAGYAIHHQLDLDMQGGAMGNLKAAQYQGKNLSVRDLINQFQAWTFNGVANLPEAPIARIKVGQGMEITMKNNTRWPHVMHLHGHHFYAENPLTQTTMFQDTTLIDMSETKTLRFLADTPGKWLLHCHMAEHMASGMVTYLEVTE